MPFTITKVQEQDFHFLQLTDDSSGIRVKILPECGALLHEFSIPLGNGRLQAVSSYADRADLRRNHPLFYRSAKLSPFPCRIAAGRYSFDGKQYEFKNKFRDGSAIHGLLFDKPFLPTREQTEGLAASVVLEHRYEGTEPGFPFPYLLTVKYTLKEKGVLRVESTASNLSGERMPIADGWHPYFSLGGRADGWVLGVDAREILTLNANLVPTGDRAAFTRFSTEAALESFALDHCFPLDFHPGKPACTLYNPANGAALAFFPDKSYPYLQIYTPDDRQSIAIENLSAAPNCLNNGIGLIVLEPGHSQSFTVEYQLGLR